MLQNHNPKRIFAILTAVLLMAILSACSGATSEPTVTDTTTGSHGGITVVGNGTAYGKPDVAQVQVGVESFTSSVTDATNQTETKIQAIMAALKAQGIADEDIQTTNYSIWPEQTYDPNTGQSTGISGYHVSNQVNVTVRDMSKTSDVLTAVTNAGATTVYGVNFSLADTTALEDQARTTAVADARTRAESLAKLAGVELGDVVVISEIIGSNGGPMPMYDSVKAMDAANSVTIAPGQLSFSTQIQVTFAIK